MRIQVGKAVDAGTGQGPAGMHLRVCDYRMTRNTGMKRRATPLSHLDREQ